MSKRSLTQNLPTSLIQSIPQCLDNLSFMFGNLYLPTSLLQWNLYKWILYKRTLCVLYWSVHFAETSLQVNSITVTSAKKTIFAASPIVSQFRNTRTLDDIFSIFYFYEISTMIPRTSTLGIWFKIAGDTCLEALLFQNIREDKSEFWEWMGRHLLRKIIRENTVM